MALLNDTLQEVARNADYDTTINLLKAFPKLDTEQFWKSKCKVMYSNKTYLSSFSGPENFLLKERSFSLTVDDTDDPIINNILIEYHPVLQQQLGNINLLIRKIMDQIKINVERQFILLKRGYDDKFSTFFQSDVKQDCVDKIIDDAQQETYDCDYYIIDANDLTFTGKYNKVKYDYHAGSDYNKNL